MQRNKYYDHENDRPLNWELDGCALSEWKQLHGKARFAVHPKGFGIFIPPEKICTSDQYIDSDPYGVERNIDNEFHKRRIALTIELVQRAVPLMNDGKPQILDLGCGQGHITDRMRQTLDYAEFTGLDYSLSAIEYAKEHFPKVDFAVGDVDNIPYAKDFFDVVVCNNLWEHVPDPLTLLSKIKDIIKPGGYLVISTPSRYRTRNLVRILLGRPVVFMSDQHVTEYSVGQVVEQLKYGGFRLQTILSRPLAGNGLKFRAARWLLSMSISLVGSHHQLEETVFYLARRPTNTAD